MPEKRTLERARRDREEGKSASTQAGEFVREEIDHIREGKHGARSAKQAIAIGLSKARRAGVEVPPPGSGKTSGKTRMRAGTDSAKGRKPPQKPSATRSRAATAALQHEGHQAASAIALSRQARVSARNRGADDLRLAARKAVLTKGPAGLKRSAGKTARTRARASEQY